MTDTFYPPTTIHVHDPVVPSLPNQINVAQHRQHGASVADEAQDDDGQISCVCGFSDDDGNTVACDLCNRWQHTICYYPQYEGRDLPEELQHYCVDCRPQQPFDATAAQSRQRLKREQQETLINSKRQGAKPNKKKGKDAPVSTYTNGWPLDKARHDRNSASPRDQPPPAKRPKTSHPASESAGVTKGHSRKRNASTVNNRSLSQTPDQPIDQYSTEFLRCYHDDDWTVTQANLHNDIAVTNALSEWLRAPDDDFRNTHGTEKREVLLRWDGELDDIPGKAQIDIQEMRDTRRSDDMHSPSWKIVTVKEPVASGAYIGELKGHVGFMNQYKDDPANRWPILRHPEPFVFFHQSLQIYIDARNEGTELRYVRRSCRPNARLQILVTDQTDYRFCFMATEQIDPGMEVAIAWDTAESIPRSANGISPQDMDILSTWVSSVLSNCGPCACHSSQGECAMSRFDRRRDFYEESMAPVKTAKGRKKKAGPHISPLNTHALNSRSGSEARKAEADDDPSDSRSASASGRGSASRDITPNTHYSTNGMPSTVPEMSERERKKLAKEEEMFRRQAEEQSGKGRKKRGSAGSNLNTPSATSTTPLNFAHSRTRYVDAATSRQTGLPSARSIGKRSKTAGNKTSAKRPRVVAKPKPDYVNASTQVDMDVEEAARHAAARMPRIKVISTQQYLLRYLAQKSTRRRGARPEHDAFAGQAVQPNSVLESCFNNAALPADVVMTDAADPPTPSAPLSGRSEPTLRERGATEGGSSDSLDTPLVETLPLPPPPPQSAHGVLPAGETSPTMLQRRVEMHLAMPPPTTNAFGSSGPPSANTSNSVGGSLVQSPSSLLGPSAPVFSPSVTAAVTPSPARKKLSLSDYTRRSKAKDNRESEPKSERDGSPASTASGPIVPALQSSSPPDTVKTGEGEESKDDVRVGEVKA